MRILFFGQGTRIINEDIIEGDPTHRLPTRLPILDEDITTSEEQDDYDNPEANNAENLEDDEIEGENDIHYNKDQEYFEEGDVMVPDTHRDF